MILTALIMICTYYVGNCLEIYIGGMCFGGWQFAEAINCIHVMRLIDQKVQQRTLIKKTLEHAFFLHNVRPSFMYVFKVEMGEEGVD